MVQAIVLGICLITLAVLGIQLLINARSQPALNTVPDSQLEKYPTNFDMCRRSTLQDLDPDDSASEAIEQFCKDVYRKMQRRKVIAVSFGGAFTFLVGSMLVFSINLRNDLVEKPQFQQEKHTRTETYIDEA